MVSSSFAREMLGRNGEIGFRRNKGLVGYHRLAMGIATVFVIPSNIEPWFWRLIFGVCAFLIARVGVQAFISFTVFR